MSHGCRKSCHFTNIRPIANRPARCVGYSDRTNSLTDLIQQPCGALHRRAAGFMVEFSTAYLHSMHTAKLGFKPLADFSVPIRPHALDMACWIARSTRTGGSGVHEVQRECRSPVEIGRASCRGRVENSGVAG